MFTFSELTMGDQTGIDKLQEEYCKGSKEKEDFALANQPVELLSAAPLSVNILGTLCLIATGEDFSLKVEGSDFPFERLKAPGTRLHGGENTSSCDGILECLS